MPWIFNPFSGTFDFYLAGVVTPPTVDGVLLAETGDYLIMESGDYLAAE